MEQIFYNFYNKSSMKIFKTFITNHNYGHDINKFDLDKRNICSCCIRIFTVYKFLLFRTTMGILFKKFQQTINNIFLGYIYVGEIVTKRIISWTLPSKCSSPNFKSMFNVSFKLLNLFKSLNCKTYSTNIHYLIAYNVIKLNNMLH